MSAFARLTARNIASPSFSDRLKRLARVFACSAAVCAVASTFHSATAAGQTRPSTKPQIEHKRADNARDVLQLGLFASRGDAEWAWIALNRRLPALADKLSALIVPGPNGSGHVLRAVVKDPGVRGETLCREAGKAGQTCFVVQSKAETTAANADAGRNAGASQNGVFIPVPQVKPPAPGQATERTVAAAPPSAPPTAAPETPAPVAAAPTAAPPIAAPPTATPPTIIAAAPIPAAAAPQTTTVAAPTVAVQPAASAGGGLTVTVVAGPPRPDIARPDAARPDAAKPDAAGPAASVAPPPARSEDGALAARTLDGFIRYSTDDAKVLAEIERRTRRRGRIGAVLPGGGLEVTPAILTQPEFNICALTFDDGPHRTVTRRILDILNQHKVVSTYFPVGNVAQRYPDVIRDFVASGHEIGNHSYTHSDMRPMKLETLRYEVAETNRILRGLGATSILFRPPYGRYSQDLLQVVREEGSQAVLWNVDTRDWKVRDPDKIVEHVVTAAGSGSVLLLHSTYPTTADALPRVISSLREKNCEFVTLSDWIARMQAAGELPSASTTNAALPGPAGNRLRN